MNWKKISENWRTFIEENELKDVSEENNYFYGKQEVYLAQEDVEGFRIFYENKFNKPSAPTAFANKANSFSITTPVSIDSRWTLKIRTASFWKRLFNWDKKLEIETSLDKFEKLIPLNSIDSLSKYFPDLKISITKYGRRQNKEISPNSKVIKIWTGVQPRNLNELKSARKLMLRILENLNENEKIKPAHNNK